ncbi:MAG: glycosyltransferase family 4 protein [Phycisphaerales bacterium]|nr:glycosyltransferase family 4 protein [Phycisphaerales bacterium]
MTRNVLYLAYFFPPRGGAAVQRSLKFAKYLPEFGWRPLVVANGGAIEDKTLKVQDPTMLKELPPKAVVRYTALDARENRRYLRAQSKFRQRLNVTDPMGWWVAPAVRLGMEMAAEHKPDAIVVTMSPFTAARAGIELKRRTGLPLVFDLRDPWALDETRIYPTRWHAGRDMAAMRRAMRVADRVVMNTPQSAAAVRERFKLPAEKVVAITNGYDAADFGHGEQRPAANDVLRIVHTGMFHTELVRFWDDLLAGRGLMNKLKHAPRAINLWTRTPRYLLEAMERVISRGEIPADKVELVLVGELSAADRELVEKSAVAGCVKMLGYTSHAQSVGWLESADVLFLPLHKPLDGGPTLVVPGKAYEYLGSGRPILAMCPTGDMRDFVTATRSGIVTGGDDVTGAAEALVKLYQAKKEGRSVVTQDRPAVERFERRYLTQRLAEVLDQVCERPHV